MLEKVEVCTYGGMSGYSVRNFGFRRLCVQDLQPCEASRTRVVAYRRCNNGWDVLQLVDREKA